MPANTSEIEKKLWNSADQLRANSNLKSSEYAVPVLGLIFLRFAQQRFTQLEQEVKGASRSKGRSAVIDKIDYQTCGVLFNGR